LDPRLITNHQTIASWYDLVLLEIAGGLLIAITDSCFTLDYIATQGYPIILVTSGRLGGINHY
jgi:dethiobiotin synthetase